MGDIQQLATELGAEERTLRRAVAQGTIHCRRQGPRRTRLPPGEEDYLRRHWGLLLELRKALRTERKVRLAVLYEQVELFREELPGLIESIHTWLKSYGVTFDQSSTPH